MKKIKFAIIGCGRIAYRHIEAIQDNKQAELVAGLFNLKSSDEESGAEANGRVIDTDCVKD